MTEPTRRPPAPAVSRKVPGGPTPIGGEIRTGQERCTARRSLGLDRDPMGGGALAEAVGFGFERCVLDDGESAAQRIAHAAGALLHDMRQFMAKQLLALHGVGLIATGGKIDIGANRECDRTDAFGLGPDMHSHS
jgi:hypothetical protein